MEGNPFEFGFLICKKAIVFIFDNLIGPGSSNDILHKDINSKRYYFNGITSNDFTDLTYYRVSEGTELKIGQNQGLRNIIQT